MNEYYSYSPLTANTVARAADVNTRFSGVETGFDKLPAPALIAEDRVTYADDIGVANAYVINPAVPVTAYNTGLRVRARVLNANTGPATVNVSGLGVKQIVRVDGTPLIANDITADQIIDLTYDGTNFRLAMAFAEMSPAGVAAKIAAAGNITINGAATVSGALTANSISQNLQTIDALSATGVALAEATDAAAARTVLALGTMATETAANYALLASPAFTGTPTVPTAATSTNTTQAASTAYVKANLAAYAPLASPSFTGSPTAPTAAVDTNTTQLATTAYVVGQNYLKSATAASTYAPLASPALTGTPTAPTAAAGTNTTQLATTAFVTRDFAKLVSPSFTGTPTAPTAASGTNTTQIATTAFVQTELGTLGGPYAPLDSPTFTGIPAAPTPAVSTNTTQIATTAFVIAQGNTVAGTIAMNGAQAAGTSLLFAKADHVHPTDTSRAPLASPGFTGTPTAPTAAANTNTTQIATTAFVLGQANSTATTIAMNGTQAAGTSLLYARADHVHPTDTSRAPLASPSFTGTPTAPTPATGNNSTLLATTAYVQANLTNYVTTGTLASYAQLSGANFSGAITTGSTLGFGSRTGQHLNLYGTTYAAGIQSNTLYFRSASRFSFHVGGSHSDLENTAGTGGTVAMTLTTAGATFNGSISASNFSGSSSGTNTGDQTRESLGVGAAQNVTFRDLTAHRGDASGVIFLGNTGTRYLYYDGTSYQMPNAALAVGGNISASNFSGSSSGTNTGDQTSVSGQAGFVANSVSFNNSGSGGASGSTFNGSGAVTVSYNTIGAAPLASPAFSGTVTAPTPAAGTNSTQVATTAFVRNEFAPLASPSFTGTPTAPTAAAGTSDTKLATTAFVDRLRSLHDAGAGVGKTLVIGDRGGVYFATGTTTVPASVFTARDVVTVYNNSAAGITLAQGTSFTLRQAGTANTGNRTISQYGFATIMFVSATEAVVSGDIS